MARVWCGWALLLGLAGCTSQSVPPPIPASVATEADTAYTAALRAQLQEEAYEAWNTRHDRDWWIALSTAAANIDAAYPEFPVKISYPEYVYNNDNDAINNAFVNSAIEAWNTRRDRDWWVASSETVIFGLAVLSEQSPSIGPIRPDEIQSIARAQQTLLADIKAGSRTFAPVVTARAAGLLACWVLGAQAVGDQAFDRDRREVGQRCRDGALAALMAINDRIQQQPQAPALPILFDLQGAELNVEQGMRLREVVSQVKSGQVRHVLDIGPAGQTEGLFEPRALATGDALVRFGIPKDRIGIRRGAQIDPMFLNQRPAYGGQYWIVLEPLD